MNADTVKEIQIRAPDDFHVHFRQGEMLRNVAPFTSNVFRRAMVMPNTSPAILTADDVIPYRVSIKDAARNDAFEPLMTIKLVGTTTPAIIEDAMAVGIVAAKLYPEGVTTNSEDGVSPGDIEKLYPVFDVMQRADLVLSLHGEVPKVFVMDREFRFLTILEQIAEDFPRLRIVLEHITTGAAVAKVKSMREGVAATITTHHLLMTLDNVLCDERGGNEFLNPHHYCKPVAKRPEDRDWLLKAAFSGNPKFFFGSDTAPHLREKKECDCGCAGVWNAPVNLPILASLFLDHPESSPNPASANAQGLERFISEFGAQFYRLPLNDTKITLYDNNDPYTVQDNIGGVVPFWARRSLGWRCRKG